MLCKPLITLVAPQGFEPRYAAPEAAVLPLNEGAMRHDGLSYSKSWIRCGQCDLLFPEHLQGLLAQDAETGRPTSADGQNRRSYQRQRGRQPLHVKGYIQTMQ